MVIDFFEEWFMILAGVCYFLAFGISSWKLSKDGNYSKIARVIFGLGWVLHFIVFILNWIELGEPPFGNMYHVIVAVGLFYFPLLLVFHWFGERPMDSFFALSAFTFAVGGVFMDSSKSWRRSPVLRSPWFVPHVSSYVTAYAFAVVAAVASLWRWLNVAIKRMRGKNDFAEYSSAYDSAILSLIRLAFPFMTMGLLFGALWAEYAWGQYWSWDNLEVWALIMWTFYLAYFHYRFQRKSVIVADVFQLLGAASLFMTWFAVKYYPSIASGLHGYAN